MQTYWGDHKEYAFGLQSCWVLGSKDKQTGIIVAKLKFYFNVVRERLTRVVEKEEEADLYWHLTRDRGRYLAAQPPCRWELDLILGQSPGLTLTQESGNAGSP